MPPRLSVVESRKFYTGAIRDAWDGDMARLVFARLLPRPVLATQPQVYRYQ